MKIGIGPLLVFLSRKTKEHAALEKTLERNNVARERYGSIPQDWSLLGGEIFLCHMTEEQIAGLTLNSKRQGDPSRDFRLGLRIESTPLKYEVYVQKWELEAVGIRYK